MQSPKIYFHFRKAAKINRIFIQILNKETFLHPLLYQVMSAFCCSRTCGGNHLYYGSPKCLSKHSQDV